MCCLQFPLSNLRQSLPFCLAVDTGRGRQKKKKARKIRKPTNFSFLFAKINKCCHTHKFSFDS